MDRGGPVPGLVECHLIAADGTVHAIVDKTPVLDAADRLRPDAVHPISLELDRRVVAETAATVDIELAHGVTDGSGRARFRVARDHVTR